MKYILFFLFYFVYFGVLYIVYEHGIDTHSSLLVAMAVTYGIAGLGVSYTLWCDLRRYAQPKQNATLFTVVKLFFKMLYLKVKVFTLTFKLRLIEYRIKKTMEKLPPPPKEENYIV